MLNVKITDSIGFEPNNLDKYAKQFNNNIKDKGSTEETYYTSFQLFLEDYFDPKLGFEVKVVRMKQGSKLKPDFTILLNNVPILLVEAKKPQFNIIEKLENKKNNRLKIQLKRYREEFGNEISIFITNFTDLILLSKSQDLNDNNHIRIEKSIKLLENRRNKWYFCQDDISRLENTFYFSIKNIVINIENINGMIVNLAKKGKDLRNAILDIYNTRNIPENIRSEYDDSFNNASRMKSFLHSIKEDLKKSLFRDDKEDVNNLFADLITQTIIYGTFGAWLKFCSEGKKSKDFLISKVGHYLPYGTFIRQLFLDTRGKLSPLIETEHISEIERIFRSSQFKKIIDKTENLMTMFYSEFLKRYDRQTAKSRGVVYTPHQIVDFIIKGIDFFLINRFDKQEGIINIDIPNRNKKSLDQKDKENIRYTDNTGQYDNMIVNFLEPTAGTMAFPCGLLKFAKRKFDHIYSEQPGLSTQEFKYWVNEFFFKRVHAFEILMAPYV
ncbi:MAG: hypothetical protein GF364_02640, partial [Candidatus Lokiarchaeota archaeon]|nr:hypothetical protein [Candidatus Lokiarchaeota archaeon]